MSLYYEVRALPHNQSNYLSRQAFPYIVLCRLNLILTMTEVISNCTLYPTYTG